MGVSLRRTGVFFYLALSISTLSFAFSLGDISAINSAVYRISWERPNGRTFHGTAFTVLDAKNCPVVMTAGHLIQGGRQKGGCLCLWHFYPQENMEPLTLDRFRMGDEGIGSQIDKMWAPGDILEAAHFPTNIEDYAILKPLGKIEHFLKLSKTAAKAGDHLYIFCCEGQTQLKVIEVRCLGGFKGKIAFEPPLGPGVSGAPIVNKDGEVVGMVVSVAESMGYASNLETLETSLGFSQSIPLLIPKVN